MGSLKRRLHMYKLALALLRRQLEFMLEVGLLDRDEYWSLLQALEPFHSLYTELALRVDMWCRER